MQLFTQDWPTHLLGPEGLRSGEVHAVVVAQVVVADDGGGLEPCTHQKVHQHGLQLRLPRLEVITRYEHLHKGR